MYLNIYKRQLEYKVRFVAYDLNCESHKVRRCENMVENSNWLLAKCVDLKEHPHHYTPLELGVCLEISLTEIVRSILEAVVAALPTCRCRSCSEVAIRASDARIGENVQ